MIYPCAVQCYGEPHIRIKHDDMNPHHSNTLLLSNRLFTHSISIMTYIIMISCPSHSARPPSGHCLICDFLACILNLGDKASTNSLVECHWRSRLVLIKLQLRLNSLSHAAAP